MKGHIIFALVSFLMQTSLGGVQFYQRIFEGKTTTISGSYSLHYRMSSIQCAFLCNQNLCKAWSMDDTNQECLIYTSPDLLNLAVAPLSTRTYIPVPHNFTVAGSYSWNEAKSYCEDLGAIMAYIVDHDKREEMRLNAGAKYGFVGLYQPIGAEIEDGIWYDVNGFAQVDSQWKSGEPDGGTIENCAAFQVNGLIDIRCNSIRNTVFMCSF